MAEVLSLDHVALHSKGSSLALSLAEGQSMCVVGPPASGKSRLLAVLAKMERPVRGTVQTPGRTSFAGRQELSRRLKPLALAKKAAPDSNWATHVLSELRLWDVRQRPISHLSETQVLACELIEPLAGDAPFFILDGHLDGLDPWTLPGAMRLIQARLTSGAVAAVATNRIELVEGFDAVVVLKDQSVVFAGSPEDLRLHAIEREIEITTTDVSGVRALVEPFEISVRETESGVLMQAKEGQTIAAKLLLEGYGSTKFVFLRRKEIEEALKRLVS